MTIEERITQLRSWDVAYYSDHAVVTDGVYDKARDEAQKLAPDHPYFKTVGAAPVIGTKVKLGYPMGSLKKVQTEDELRAWLPSVPVFVSLKLDGISILLRYVDGRLVQAATRGDGTIGEDITENARKMQGVHNYVAGFTGYIRGEVILKKSVFATKFETDGYKNCRNAAGGAAKDLAGARCKDLTVMCYMVRHDSGIRDSRSDEWHWLESRGFITAGRGWRFTEVDGVVKLYDQFTAYNRAALDFEIDGLVVEIDDTDAREALGEADMRPEGSRAFKFPPMIAETVLRSVEWQTGASGRVTPVAVFDPVELGGATVSRATLHNIGYMYRLAQEGLYVGDTVVASKRNDVIPAIESVIKTEHLGRRRLSAPTTCPSCGQSLTMDGEYLVCNDNADCPAQTEGSIKRWITKIGVKDFGAALIQALCDSERVKEPADLYTLTPDEVAAVELSGKIVGLKNARTALTNLSTRRTLPLHTVIGSLGIPLWGRSSVKTLVDAGYDTLEKLRALPANQLSGVAGIGDTKAESFVTGLAALKEPLDRLLVYITIAPPATGTLRGSSVCFTGFRDGELERKIEEAGGTMKSGIVKGLNYLVAKDPDSGSAKLTKARSDGVKVIGIEEMRALIGA